jgi:hypothetical protein
MVLTFRITYILLITDYNAQNEQYKHTHTHTVHSIMWDRSVTNLKKIKEMHTVHNKHLYILTYLTNRQESCICERSYNDLHYE